MNAAVEAKRIGRPPARFVVRSIAPNGRKTQRSVDTVVEAWDWYANYPAPAPLNVVEIIDRELAVEARA